MTMLLGLILIVKDGYIRVGLNTSDTGYQAYKKKQPRLLASCFLGLVELEPIDKKQWYKLLDQLWEYWH